MKQIWYYFNTLQVASTFADEMLINKPANVEMINGAYHDIINVKMIPDNAMLNIQQQFGMRLNGSSSPNNTVTNSKNITDATSLNDTDKNAQNSKKIHRQLFVKEISKKTILRNQVIVGGILIFLVTILILTVVFRQKIWEKLPATAKNKLVSIKNSIFWNMFIRTLLEMFYPVMIA